MPQDGRVLSFSSPSVLATTPEQEKSLIGEACSAQPSLLWRL
jgi:hypothetical protein